jgi:Tfp pilus assembly protein PilN
LLSENSNNVNIDGEAFTNEELVRFIDNLKASPLLTGVMLIESNQSTQDAIEIYKYKLQFVYKGL